MTDPTEQGHVHEFPGNVLEDTPCACGATAGEREHSHPTGGAWHVTRWQVPGCPACDPAEPDAGDVVALTERLARVEAELDSTRTALAFANESVAAMREQAKKGVGICWAGTCRQPAVALINGWPLCGEHGEASDAARLDAVRRKAGDERAEQIAQAIEAEEAIGFPEIYIKKQLAARIARESR